MKAALFGLVALTACVGKSYQELAPFACPEDHLCPDGYACVSGVCDVNIPCDPAAQNPCATAGQRSRCTLVAMTGNSFSGQCVKPPPGPVPAGVPCSLSYSTWESQNLQVSFGQFYGDDRFCAAGSICENLDMAGSTNFGGGPTGAEDPYCRPFCDGTTTCSAGTFCLDAFGKQSVLGSRQTGAPVGVCYGSCAFFSNTCGAGSACGPAPVLGSTAYTGACHKVGGGSEGNQCSGFSGCGPGLHCVPEANTYVCRALCDGSHACTKGTCDTATLSLPNGAGVCR